MGGKFGFFKIISLVIGISHLNDTMGYKHADEVEYTQPNKECKPGYTRAGDVCRRVETRQPQKYCKKGWKLIDGMCSYRSVKVLAGECPPESFWDGKTCILHETCDWIERCPPDATMVKGKCVTVTRSSPVWRCPKGFKNSGDGSCFAETKFKGQFSCPDGFFPGKHGCSRLEDIEPTSICEHGYVFQDGVCIKEITYDVVVKCTQGYLYSDEHKKCFRKIQKEAVPKCPSDTDYDSNSRTCVRTRHSKPKAECPDGYEICKNNMCKKIIYEEASLICQDGHILEGGSCVSVTFEDADYICENGELYNDGYCSSIEFVAHKSYCKHGFVEKDGLCVSRKTAEPSIGCEKGFTLCDGICRKVASAPKERTCVDGELRGKKCIGYITINAESYCKVGRIETGQCLLTEEVCPITECPPGYEKLKDGMCGKESACYPKYQCPPGSTRIGLNKCESIVAEKANFSCPKHYTLIKERCQRIFEALPEVSCPSGWKLKDGICVKHRKVPKECSIGKCD